MKYQLSIVAFFSFLLLSGLAAFLFFFNVGSLLAMTDQPRDVDVIICLSGNNYLSRDSRMKKAVSLLRQGYSQQLIFTAKTYYQKVLEYNIDKASILVTGQDARTTFQEVLYVKPLLKKYNFVSAMVVSDPYHLYRVRWTFQRLCGDLPVKFSFVATDLDRETKQWWKNRQDRHFVLTELPKIFYYYLYHGVLGISENPDGSNRLKLWYNRILWEVDRKIDEREGAGS